MILALALLALVAAMIGLWVDRRQTIYIARHPEPVGGDNDPSTFYETNPLLGRNPSVTRVRNYFGLCCIVMAGGGLFVSVEWALAIALVVAAVQAIVVVRNYRLGIPLL